MPKPIKVTDSGVVEEPKGEREKRWAAYLANYEAKNPVKYASKRATSFIDEITGLKREKPDEFATIPPSFR